MKKITNITRESVKENQLYLWVANEPEYTNRVVRLSGCGDYLVEGGDFGPEYWDLDAGLIGVLYEVSVDMPPNELISEDESEDFC
ncbi:MAG: hypothetical protein ACRDCV_13820 [Plesiomonas shigelloides]